MRTIIPYITLNIALLLAFVWSGPLAYESAVLAGFLSEARVESARVVQKGRTTSRTFRGLERRYLVSWSETDIRLTGPHIASVERDLWERTKVGDAMTLVYIGTRQTPVWKESIERPARRALFHGSLFALEIGVILWAGLNLRNIVRQRRRLQAGRADKKT